MQINTKVKPQYQKIVHFQLKKYSKQLQIETNMYPVQQNLLKNIWNNWGSTKQVLTFVGLHIQEKACSQK